MPQLLPTSRAARLAGISRGELQRRIRTGDLSTFEGSVDINELIKLYPEINLDGSGMLEKVRDIKANARPKKRYEEAIPSAEVLVSRLKAVGQDLFHARTDIHRLEKLVSEIKGRMQEICAKRECDPKQELSALTQWIDKAFQTFSDSSKSAANVRAKDAFMRIMAAHIKLLPSGREFFLEGQDTLLAASVRSGLYVNYGCTKGNCGSCKARLVEGEVHQVRDHDYILSEHEKSMGYLLMCSNTAVTDVVLEAAEAESAADIPQQRIRAAIRKVESLEEDLRLLHITTPRTHTLRFMAGQSIRLTLDQGETTLQPVASCPCDSLNLQILLRRNDADSFINAVFTGLELPETVTLVGPEGDFVLRNDVSNPLLFIAVDDGFAPIRSLIEHAISMDNAESVQLIRITRETKTPFLDGLCRSWSDALDNFSYRHLAGDWQLEQLLESVRAVQENPSALHLYIAGLADPQPLLESLIGLGIERENIRWQEIG